MTPDQPASVRLYLASHKEWRDFDPAHAERLLALETRLGLTAGWSCIGPAENRESDGRPGVLPPLPADAYSPDAQPLTPLDTSGDPQPTRRARRARNPRS